MKISVVVPCFNCEKTIEHCVNSIIEQNVDLELICIEDCSSDNTLAVLKELTKSSLSIKLINNPNNLGASKTRNIGIKNATGDYITFVDSDDYLEPNCYEKIVDILKKEKSDILRYNTTEIEISDTNKKHFDKTIDIKTEFNWVLERFFTNKDNFQTFSPLLFVKKEVFKNVRYNENVCMMEDAIFYYDLLCDAETLYLCDIKGYNYVKNEKSITQNYKNAENNIKDVLFVNKYLTNKVSDTEIKQDINANTIDIICELLLNLSKIDKKEYTRIAKTLSTNTRLRQAFGDFTVNNISKKKRFFIWSIMKKHFVINGTIINLFRILK
ncbi:glycosyltransferase family 2 protein [Candidatus Saccharibacteria bacterium]|nr:glycosyltransferase family 2 protein [Candidatus Saccharibacteria bacterium]